MADDESPGSWDDWHNVDCEQDDIEVSNVLALEEGVSG
jgi:hypothetical protein